MKQLFTTILDSVKRGECAVLSTVIASSGSSPRGEGSRMLTLENGTTMGTIGGGAVEYQSQKIAEDVIKNKQSHTKAFILRPNDVADIGMICGGNVMVYFQYFAGGDETSIALLQHIVDVYHQNHDAWLILDITDETAWTMMVYDEGSGLYPKDAADISNIKPLLKKAAVREQIDDKKYYVEPIVSASKVFVFGGGHVAQELVPVLTHVDFRCVVLDDRPQFANATLFPTAWDIRVIDLENFLDVVDIGEKDYVVIMTRGHQYDYGVLSQALKTPAQYVGLIGSRKKIATTNQKLKEDGFTDADIARIYTPIGLEILAETPAEIAISVAGEMIKVRAEEK